MERAATARSRGPRSTAMAKFITLWCGGSMLLASAAMAQRAGGQPAAEAANPRAAAIYRSAAALQNRELTDLAATEWASLIDQCPQDPLVGKARYYRGVCLVQLKRYLEAEAEFQRVISEHPTLDASLLERAYANLGLAQYRRASDAQGDAQEKAFDQAIATLGKQLARFPDGPHAAQASFYRAEACTARQDHAGALAGYHAVVDKHPEHPLRPASLYGIGIVQQELDRLDEAASAFNRLLAEYPSHALAADARLRRAEVLLARGQCRAAANDDEGAIADLARLSERWPESSVAPQALLLQAQLEERRGDYSAAHATLGRFLVNYRDHALVPQARWLRATVRYELGLFADAIDDAIAYLDIETDDVASRSHALLIRGMCEAKLYRTQDAVQSFELIVRENQHSQAVERALYELAWAYDATGQPERSLATFRQLATDYPNSPLAAECWFRVGEAQFAAGDHAAAAESFASAYQQASDAALQEKAAHKLAWSEFSLDQFEKAEQSFAGQLADFPNGSLAADARLMVAECKFARRDYSKAMAVYSDTLADATASDEIRELGLLHAARSAAHLKNWQQCAGWLKQFLSEFPDSQQGQLARCELGCALYHLQQMEAARREFTAIFDGEDKGLAARAQFMIGEVHFAQKQYDAAVRAFFHVAYGYGDGEVPEAVRHWQAESLFEAARCLEQLKRSTSAQKIYRELVERYPESEKAQHARVAMGEQKTKTR